MKNLSVFLDTYVRGAVVSETSWPPKWPLLKKIDSFLLGDGTERWIIHTGGCQRLMTADGLCSCVDPPTFDIRADGSGRR